MGGSSSSSSGGQAATLEKQIVLASGSSRQQMLNDLVKKYKNIDDENFYTLFELALYSDMTPENTTKVGKKFRAMLLRWHPDHNHDAAKKEECELMVGKLVLGRQVLTTPDLKRRYDIELRAAKGETSTFGWYAAWGWNVAMVAGGLGLIIAGATGAAFTAGATTPAMVAGNAMLMSGVQTSSKMYRDPNCSGTEFIKDAVVGGVAGGAAGAIGVGGAACMEGLSTMQAVGIAAGVGASGYAANHITNDAAARAIHDVPLFKNIKDNVSDSKSAEEVWSRENGKMFLTGCTIGAVVGGFAQGAACAAAADDVAVAGSRTANEWGKLAPGAPGRRAVEMGARRAAAAAAAVADDAAALTATQGATAVVHGGVAWCSAIRDADEESRSTIFDLVKAAREATRIGDMETADKLVQEINRKCMAAAQLTAQQRSQFKAFLEREDIRTFQQVQQYVAHNVDFDWNFCGNYRHAAEILSDKKGVCLEYSTLTYALTSVFAPGRCKVIIGLMRGRDNQSMHAWVEFDGVPHEPQTKFGSSVIDYNYDVPDYTQTGGPNNELRPGGPYVPWFKYTTTSREVVSNMVKSDIYTNFFIGSGIKVNRQVPLVTADPVDLARFVGHWEDDLRGFRIFGDGMVSFTWSKVRDVKTFRASKGKIDEKGLFTFTLSFPPDKGNPDGKAEWNLQTDGGVTIFFNHLMPNGEFFSKVHMKHRKPN